MRRCCALYSIDESVRLLPYDPHPNAHAMTTNAPLKTEPPCQDSGSGRRPKIEPRSPENGKAGDETTGTAPAPRVRATRIRLHTAHEWEAMYPLIRHLYITENRKLAEVMTTLERHHGFKAT